MIDDVESLMERKSMTKAAIWLCGKIKMDEYRGQLKGPSWHQALVPPTRSNHDI
jgi:hypothetical protein